MFKNWKAICEITDAHVMWALAMLDLRSDLGRKFVKRFPEYFTKKKSKGPIPLSVLRQVAQKDAIAAYGPDFGDYSDNLQSVGTCAKYNIPTQPFSGSRGGYGYEPLPAELAHLKDAKGIGQIAEWGGKKFVVVDNGMPEFIYLAPAELIAVDR